MSYKWDDELIKKFLTLYRKHKCLWNPYSPNYRNCSDKNEAFKIVVQQLNVPQIRISDCIQQIEVIREKYKQEQLKAEKELKSGKLYTSKIPWFNLMSQMLCEVINDEENFSDDPVTFVPCNVTRGGGQEESSNFLYKPEKYAGRKSDQNDSSAYVTLKENLEQSNLGLKNLPNRQSRDINSQHELKTVNDADALWNRCPDCGWENDKNQDQMNDGASRFNGCKESGVQIHTEIEAPLKIKRTRIFNTNNNIEEFNQLKPLPPSLNDTNYLNHKVRTPEKYIMQNRKKVQINADIEPWQNCRGNCDPTQQEKSLVPEDKTIYQEDSESRKFREVISLKDNNKNFPRSNNEIEKRVIMCRSHIDGIDQSQFLKNQIQNIEINEANNRNKETTPNLVLYQDSFASQSQEISGPEDGNDGKKNTIANRCSNSGMQRFVESSTGLATTTEADKYEVCSRFRIIIPSSNREDQSLEITRYEVRMISPQLSEYVLRPSSETSKVAIRNADCACRNDFSVSQRNANVDSARYGSIIKLDINHKSSKETRAKRRSCSSGTSCMRPEHDLVPEIGGEHKSFSNKRTQTEPFHENQSIQTPRNVETTRFHSSEDQGYATDVASVNGESHQVTTPNENSVEQHQSTSNDDSQMENGLLPAENFHNTRIFLNVIVKILQSDDTHDKSEDLQTTLDTMLERFQNTSITARNETEYHTHGSRNATNNSQNTTDNAPNETYSSRNATYNSQHATDNTSNASYTSRNATYDSQSMTHEDTLLESTQYENFASNLAPANKPTRNMNSRKATNEGGNLRPQTVELDDTRTNSRPQIVELDDTSTNLRQQSPIRGETNNVVNEQNTGSLNERNKSINDRSTRSGPYASILNDMNASNLATSSFLDSTYNSTNEEPIASSSRRIREHRSPSELMKDFLDAIKFTMAMDGILQTNENGDKDCCNKPNKSTGP